MNYRIVQAQSRREIDDFINLPRRIYKGCPYYIPDLDSDVRKMLENTMQKEFSVVQPFVAYDEQNNPVGRIAGIINYKANNIWNTHYARFGLIEFIDDEKVSKLLLETVEEWGRCNGMDKIQGPMGVTDFDKEGMLVEDFDQEGSMTTNYNPSYYPVHLEKLGYSKQVDWQQIRLEIPSEVPMRFHRAANVVREMYELKVVKMSRHEIYKGGYDKKLFQLLNEAYKPLFGYSELDEEQCNKFFHQYIQLLDLRMIPFVLDKEGNLVAIAITMGSLNNALKKSDGRLLPFGWRYFLKSLKFKHEEKAEMLLIAVDPNFQGLGINALIFDDLIPVYNQLGYKWAETAPMLETNTKVQTQWKHLEHKIYKRRRCYSKNL